MTCTTNTTTKTVLASEFFAKLGRPNFLKEFDALGVEANRIRMEGQGRRIVSIKLEPGEYWIGDPCYAIKDPSASEELMFSSKLGALPEGTVTKDGTTHRVVACSTMFGDGVYEGSDGHLYPVDTARLGIMPSDTALAFGATREELTKLGRFASFKRGLWFVWFEEYGLFKFGRIKIDTCPFFDEEELDEPDDGA